MPAPDQPYTDADYTKINTILADLNRVKLMIDQACSAEIEVEGHKVHCEELQRKYNKLKAAYFPQRP